MTFAEPLLIRWGPIPVGQEVTSASAHWSDLAPDRNSADQAALVQRLAALPADRAVVLLKSGVVLPEAAKTKLMAAADQTGGQAVLVPLNNLDPALSPLPPGTRIEAPLDLDGLDRLCGWLGERIFISLKELNFFVSFWPAGVAARMLASGAAGQVELPDSLYCYACDHAFAGDPGRPLSGPEHWPLRDVPPPASPLDALRARWQVPVPGDFDATLPVEKVSAPPGPVPGLDLAPVVLHICHNWGGGSERFIRDVSAADDKRCHLLLTAHGSTPRQSFGEWLELRPAADPTLLLARYPLSPTIADTAIAHGPYETVLSEILARWDIAAVMVSSLIGHGLAALTTGLPTLIVCHDYYPLWPELHCDFGDAERRFDRAELKRDLAVRPLTLFARHTPDYWWRLREKLIDTLVDRHIPMATPTGQVRENILRMAPELAALDWHVVPHGITPWPAATSAAPAPPERKRLRVLVPGRIGGGKGQALIQSVMDRTGDNIEFVFLGAGVPGNALHGRARAHVIHEYRREQLPDLLAMIQPDLALLPATVAETFGYLLSELQSLGLPVMATAIGSYRERIRDGIDGLLVPPDAAMLAERLESLTENRTVLAEIRRTLLAQPFRATTDMAADYHRLLPVATPAAARSRLRIASPADLRNAWLMRHALETGYHRDRLHTLYNESEKELERRGEWGFALQKQLDERTKWALSLQDDIQREHAAFADLQRRHETSQAQLHTIYRSRSWRFMGPFRVLARKLRAARARLDFQLKRLRARLRRARLSVATRGLGGSLRHWKNRLRIPAGPALAPIIAELPASAIPPTRLPTSEAPLVSIVIPIHGKLAYTCACLASLAEHAGPTPFEVIVVDDDSPDGSAEALASVEGLRLLRNERNLGFVGSCNAGAAAASGRWLVFLNNDTVVTAGWLEALLRTFDDFADAGLVGARLVYPDGRLQEAGGLVFSDGSGWNYGRFGDPADPRYRYARQTDYCSGAAIAIAHELFERLGGFDERYAPAYYEDTDLAFKVREAGMKVICQPASTVVHFEGVTSGTDTGSGVKRYQIVNQEKFLARWSTTLAKQPAPGTDVERIVRAAPNGRVLVIDATTPEPDKDSGSVRLTHIMRLLRESGRHVTFFADNRAYVPGYTEALQRIGVEVLYHPWLSDPVDWLREHGPDLSAVMVCRHYIAASYIDLVRQFAPQARFIFDTVDLHYLREERAAALAGSSEIARQASLTRAQELRLIRSADVTLVVSPAEQALLAREVPDASIDVLSNIHEVHGCRRGYAERRDLMFVGGFQHPPNSDAVQWFVAEIFPLVRAALPDVKFHIIGSRMPPAIRELTGNGVEVHGFVEDIDPFLDGCRIAVAPLRYGAGVKGKVNMSMSCGQPVVATTVAVEGMRLRAGEEVLVADAAADFAAGIVRLYSDESLWNRLSAAGIENVRAHFSFDAARAALVGILGD
jgi:GT2 family glycosyltransferase